MSKARSQSRLRPAGSEAVAGSECPGGDSDNVQCEDAGLWVRESGNFLGNSSGALATEGGPFTPQKSGHQGRKWVLPWWPRPVVAPFYIHFLLWYFWQESNFLTCESVCACLRTRPAQAAQETKTLTEIPLEMGREIVAGPIPGRRSLLETIPAAWTHLEHFEDISGTCPASQDWFPHQ